MLQGTEETVKWFLKHRDICSVENADNKQLIHIDLVNTAVPPLSSDQGGWTSVPGPTEGPHHRECSRDATNGSMGRTLTVEAARPPA